MVNRLRHARHSGTRHCAVANTRVSPAAGGGEAAPAVATMAPIAKTRPACAAAGGRAQQETSMNPFRLAALAAAALCATGAQAQDAGQLNVICSVQAEWCNMIQTVFAKTTGIKVNMSLKGSGEALAQIIAEKANPKTDVWFGGTGDPHLQAAEMGLTLEYKSATLPQLYPVGAAAGHAIELQDGGHLLRAAGLRLQPRTADEEEAGRAEELGRPAEAGIQGRDPGGQPGLQRHGLHHGGHAGAADGRGQGLRLHEGPAQERRPVHPLGHRADQGGGARRDGGVDQLRARRPRREDAGLSGRDRHSGRRHWR